MPYSYRDEDDVNNSTRRYQYAPMHKIRHVWCNITNPLHGTIHHKDHHPSRVALLPTLRLQNATLFFTLSGITEAICYRHYHVNINLMTGNTIRCINALANGDISDFIFLSSIITCYILGGILFTKLLAWRIISPSNQCSWNSTTSTRARTRTRTRSRSSRRSVLLFTITKMQHLTLKHPNAFVSAFSFTLFAMSDLMGYILGIKFKIAMFAMAFGLANAVAYHMFGYVTHSVTGTYDAIGRKLKFSQHQTQKYKMEDHEHTINENTMMGTGTGTGTGSGSGTGMTINFNAKNINTSKSIVRGIEDISEELCGFLVGLLSTFVLCNLLESKPSLYAICPPLGLSLGFAHVILFAHLFSKRNRRLDPCNSFRV